MDSLLVRLRQTLDQSIYYLHRGILASRSSAILEGESMSEWRELEGNMGLGTKGAWDDQEIGPPHLVHVLGKQT